MNKRPFLLGCLGLLAVFFLAMANGAGSAWAMNRGLAPTPPAGPGRRDVHPETGRLSFLGFDPGEGPRVGRGMSVRAQGAAFLGRYAAEFGVRNVDRDLRVIESRGGERGRVRYQQVFEGIPVLAGELSVNLRADGELSSMNGEVSPDLALETSPQVSAAEARQTALEAVAKYQEVSASALEADEPELWIYDERLLLPSDRPAELVWRTEVRSRSDAPIRELVLINAMTGGLSLHFNQVDVSWGPASPLQQDTDTPTPSETPSETPGPSDTPTPTDTEAPSDTPTHTSSPTATATPAPFFDMVLDEARGKIYASDQTHGEVDVFDLADLSYATSVALGGGSAPAGMDMAQDNSELAVALSGAGAIAFIDLDTLDITATVVPTGFLGPNTPWDVVYGVSGRAYSVGNPAYGGTDYIHVLDTASYSQIGLSTEDVRFGPRLGMTASRTTLYVNEAGRLHGLRRFDVSTDTPQLLGSTDGTPSGPEIALVPDGSKVFTSGPQAWAGTLGPGPLWAGGSFGVHVEYIGALDLVAWGLGGDHIYFSEADTYAYVSSETFSPPTGAFRAVADGTRLIVSTSGGLAEVDLSNYPPTPTSTATSTSTPTFTSTYTPTATLTPMPVTTGTVQPLPGLFFDMEVDDARGLIYASNPTEDSIDVYSISGLEWVTSLYFGDNPRGIDISPDGQELAVALEGTGSVVFIDLDNYSAVANVIPGETFGASRPYDVLYGRPGRLYSVGNPALGGSDLIHVFDTASHTEIARAYGGLDHCVRLGMTGDQNTLYVAETCDNFSPKKIYRFDISADTPVFVSQGPHGPMHLTTMVVLSDGSKIFTSRGEVWQPGLTTATWTLLGTWPYAGPEIEYLPIQGMVAVTAGSWIAFVDIDDYSVVQAYWTGPTAGVARVTGDGSVLIVSTAYGLTAMDLSSFPLPTATAWPTRTPTPSNTPTASATLNPNPFSGARRTFDAGGSYSLPGSFLCNEAVDVCTGGAILDADLAHAYAKDALDFYATYHERDSLDDARMIVDSTVRYGSGVQNAYWNGQQLIYGAGWSRADDVVGHEFTHGVTDHESSLFYYYQSGAINESLSDVWGEFIDQTNGAGNDDPSVKWLTGEDIVGVGALRSMSNPPAFGDPDRMTSGNYYLGAFDNGGVHWNSGVNNKAAYLLTDGGSFNGYTIRALGMPKVAAIYYEAQTNLLTSGSDYADLHNLLFQACQNLIGGSEGITSSDCLEVREATSAVEMHLQPVAGFNPEAAECPAGLTRSVTLFSDDLENGTAQWTFGALAGTSRWGIDSQFYGPYARSGMHSLYADDWPDDLSDSYAAMAADIPLPAGAFLRFAHAYGFEDPNWDGGVLEYSTDGGTTWRDAGLFFSEGRSYGGTIWPYVSPQNTLSGRQGFIGDSHGYVGSRYALTSQAGQSIRFRFRMATDTIMYDRGWFVDDIEIYTCLGAPAVPSLVSPASSALVTDYTPLLQWADAANADHYDLQIATNSAFSSPVVNAVPSLSEYAPATDLDPNMTHWWRVRTVNAVGQESAWSAVRTFRTAILPPTLSWPTNGEPLLASRPTFDWEDAAGASGYTLQVSTASIFATTVINVTTTPSHYTPTSDLSPKGATLYWRVRANGANGPSAWSEVRDLVSANPPSVPVLSLPTSNALVTNYTPTLDWSDSTGGGGVDHYQVQVATNASFSGASEVDEPLSQYTFPSDLAPNSTYWWRVRAHNAVGQYSAWSAARSFRTVIVRPVPASPIGGAGVLTTRPAFDWDDVTGASGYTLQVSTLATFSSTVLNVTSTPSTFTPTIDVNPRGVLLYWRVRGNGTNGPSAWSDPETFVSANPPSVPTLSLPALNALVTDYTPRLDWSDSSGGGGVDHYQLELATNSAFSGAAQIDIVPPSEYTFSTDLNPNTTYWWRVRSYNAAGQYSQWPAARTFRTVMVAPTLSSPGEGETVLTPRPLFDWQDVPGATAYDLNVSTSPSLSPLLVSTQVSGVSQYGATADLAPRGVLLYWRVRARGPNGPSAWSAVGSFISANPPSIPSLISPANGVLLTDHTPDLQWSDSTGGGGVDHYLLEVATNSAFGSSTQIEADLSEYTFPTDLTPNTTYWWRLRAFNAGGQYSRWSATRTFRTVIVRPVPASPIGGMGVLTTRPTFDWGDVAGASGYTLQVSTVPSFATTVVNVTSTPSIHTRTADVTPKGVLLYWRVRANGPNGPSAWSDTETFVSADPPSVPSLVSPASNALLTDYTPDLQWSDSTGGGGVDHYQLQVATTSFFSGATELDRIPSDYTFPTDLDPNTTYWWRVRSYNAAGQYSQWTAARTFRTVIVKPVPASPIGGVGVLTSRPTFDWEDVAGASNYTLQVSAVPSFATTVVNITSTPSTHTRTADVNPKGVLLYWRVRANGPNGPSAWSDIETFVSANPPSVPSLVSPASNALVTDYTPRLDWSDSSGGGGVDHYEIWVHANSTFTEMVYEEAVATSDFTPPVDLTPNRTYWWKVRAHNASGQYSLWSAVRTFRAAVLPPTWSAPVEGAVLTTQRPVFDWSDVTGATSYSLQVSSKEGFGTLLVNTTLVPSTYTPASNLPKDVVLYARVRANGPNGPGLWSLVAFIIIP